MLSSKTSHKSSYIHLFSRTCTGLNYQSRYNNSNRRVKIRKDRPRNLRKIEDPVSSMDMAYIEPHVKKWKHWNWNYNRLTSQQYQKLKRIRDKKQRMYEKEDELPYWFDLNNPKWINVIFIRDMDEFLAGQVAKIETGLYRNWLQPQKIALPASTENIERWKHLNLDKRAERDTQIKMEQISNDISQVRLEMKLRRDPDTDEVYTTISKQKICRKLLLLKRITVKPEQIVINRLAASILTVSEDDNEIGDGFMHVINEAGSYTIKLLLDGMLMYDYEFEFRLNVRYNEIEKSNKTPFTLKEGDDDEEDDEDEQMDEDEAKRHKLKKKELKTNLKKWKRAKQANQMLDGIVNGKSRYSDLYNVSKLDLSQNVKVKEIPS